MENKTSVKMLKEIVLSQVELSKFLSKSEREKYENDFRTRVAYLKEIGELTKDEADTYRKQFNNPSYN